ncbi:helix-turn-helix transcriptional regulator [Collimonas sp.]|jgi:transcriptional regulator with XRE-family HTH domain|uniref:helix-turn-helix domain-containing protein n=1 Tax=Collimonas sp. TaxID=1963772 RepID=UPI002CCCA258|nr:helix-turn-helix transcriptional regulator [Collimonas sp.]HWX02036.1 helix-turn-helix transcriptional regulator [Collimonas sp.]
MNIGERITEERKRLDYSQTKFASLAKVSLSSQKRYESGERDPDTTYLENLKQIGVDTSYVITGTKKNIWQITYGEHLLDLGHVVASVLNISPEELDIVVKKAGLIADSEPYRKIPDSRVDERVAIFDEFFFINASALITQKINKKFSVDQPVDFELNRELLTLILERIESCLSEKNLEITARKKAAVTTMLYRSFSGNGKVDTSIVEEAVELASGIDPSNAVGEKQAQLAHPITGKNPQINSGKKSTNISGNATVKIGGKKKDIL